MLTYCLGAINRHKSTDGPRSQYARSNAYVNPNYRPPGRSSSSAPSSSRSGFGVNPNNKPREVLLDGVAFQSSSRSLVRKDRAFQQTLRAVVVADKQQSSLTSRPPLQYLNQLLPTGNLTTITTRFRDLIQIHVRTGDLTKRGEVSLRGTRT